MNFHNIFKTDTKQAEFLDRIKDPLHKSAICKLWGIRDFKLKHRDKDSWPFENLDTAS